MCTSYFNEYRRFNEDHSLSITVSYDELAVDDLQGDVQYFGFDFLTTNAVLAKTLGVEQVSQTAITHQQLEALATGDHVFFLRMGEHSGYYFDITLSRPQRDWDSGCVGLLIVRHQKWFASMPRSTFAKSFVFKKVRELFAERISNTLNGWIYRADVMEDGEYVDGCCGCLTCEDALEQMQRAFPQILYKEDDFTVASSYSLIS